MTVRNVKKNLLGMEDVIQGKGSESQTRNNTSLTINKVDTPFALDTTLEMQNLDVAKYTRARVYTSTSQFIDYIYDAAATTGITSNTGAGRWVAKSYSGRRLEFTTLDNAKIGLLSDGSTIQLRIGDTFRLIEKTTGEGIDENLWDVIDATSEAANGFSIIAVNVTISFKKRYPRKTFKQSVIPTTYIAHRGGVDIAPENTIVSLSNIAINKLAPWVEFDIQTTVDNIPVLYHDATLDSLTDGTGAVAVNTLAQVQTAKFTKTISTRYEDERIPTLADSLDKVVLPTGIKVLAEIQLLKEETDVDIIVGQFQSRELQDRTVFYTGYSTPGTGTFARLERIRELDPDRRFGLAVTAVTPSTAEIDDLLTLGGDLYYLIQHTTLTQSVVDYAKARNIQVIAWTPDFQSDISANIRALGVNYILIDRLPGGLSSDIPGILSPRAIDGRFGQTSWFYNITGAGTVNYDSTKDILTCSANASDRARVDYTRFNALGGTTVQINCFARNVSGADEGEMTLGDGTTTVQKVKFNSTEWQPYSLTWLVPAELENQDLVFALGSQIGLDSTCEVTRFSLEVGNNYDAPDGVIARGVISISNVDNSMSFVANQASFGLSLTGRIAAGEYDIALDTTRDFTTQKPQVHVEALARSVVHPMLIAQSKGLSGTTDGSFTTVIARIDTGARFDGTDGATPILYQVTVRV